MKSYSRVFLWEITNNCVYRYVDLLYSKQRSILHDSATFVAESCRCSLKELLYRTLKKYTNTKRYILGTMCVFGLHVTVSYIKYWVFMITPFINIINHYINQQFRKKLRADWGQEMLAIIRCSLLSSRLLSQNLKTKIYRIIILPVVLYVCEAWSLTAKERRKLRVFENMVLRLFCK